MGRMPNVTTWLGAMPTGWNVEREECRIGPNLTILDTVQRRSAVVSVC